MVKENPTESVQCKVEMSQRRIHDIIYWNPECRLFSGMHSYIIMTIVAHDVIMSFFRDPQSGGKCREITH